MGLAPGTLVPLGSTSQSLLAGGSSRRQGALSASEDLYRGADTLAYGDNKPSEDALDRVTGQINKEYVLLLDGEGTADRIGWINPVKERRGLKRRVKSIISTIGIRCLIRRLLGITINTLKSELILFF
jgi:hypothetical protein